MVLLCSRTMVSSSQVRVSYDQLLRHEPLKSWCKKTWAASLVEKQSLKEIRVHPHICQKRMKSSLQINYNHSQVRKLHLIMPCVCLINYIMLLNMRSPGYVHHILQIQKFSRYFARGVRRENKFLAKNTTSEDFY